MFETALLPRKLSSLFFFFFTWKKNIHFSMKTKKVEKARMVLLHSHVKAQNS